MRILIIDGDYAMAFGDVDRDRDLTRPIDELRSTSGRRSLIEGWPDAETMACLPDMRKGKIAAALVKITGRIRRPGSPSGDSVRAMAPIQLLRYISPIISTLASAGEARVLTTRGEFTSHMEEWEVANEHRCLPIGFVLGLDGANPILQPQQVHEWWDRGLRVISLSHYGVSTYSHDTGTETRGGLYPPDHKLLREMESLGMMLNVTHLSDQSAREVFDLFAGPLLASYQNCRAVTPGERQQPDYILLQVIHRD